MSAPVTLILGGARSGKSLHAERLAEARPGPCVYLATAEAGDPEMAHRIRAHRERRGDRWTTLEEPLELTAALQGACAPDRTVLIDCLTLWLSNLLGADRDPSREDAGLLEILPRLAGPSIFVSNEVGQGIVPANVLARQVVDEAGHLHQALAAASDIVIFMTAGLPLALKGAPETTRTDTP